MSFTIRRILGIAPVIVLGLLLLTPAPGVAQTTLKPDLVVTSLTPPPASALPGFAFLVTAGVRNLGLGAAGVSITKFELVSTAPGSARKGLEGTQNISALAPGASEALAVTVVIDEGTAPGTYFFQACANGTGPKIQESNPNNNCLKSSGTITVLELPNLAVTLISNPPSATPQGQFFPTTYTVTNTSGVSAGATLVKFYLVPTVGTGRLDLKTKPAEVVGTLGPGATFTHTLNLIVRPETGPGTYRLQACADGSGNAVTESNEDDNCKTSVGTVQVTPAPDLIVQNVIVTGAPLTVEQGEALTIAAVVRNTGLLAAPASTMTFRLVSTGVTPLSKNLSGKPAVPGVLQGTKVTLNATPIVDEDTVPGSYTVQACVDSDKTVAEISESNNCGTALGTVTVLGLPLSPADLRVTALTPPLATRLPGETLPVMATHQNHGTGASLSTTTKFNLVNVNAAAVPRKKNLKGVQILDPLAAGATKATEVTVEVYPDTVPGTYLLEACADGENALHESNENDNCLTSTATVTVLQVPNLVITQVGNPPATAVPGKTSFLVTETVQNVGPVGAPASVVGFTLVSTVDPTIRFDLKGVQDVPALVPTAIFNGSGTVTVRSETLPGSYRVQACADYKKVIRESDEDANCSLSAGAVQVAAVADLIVQAVRLPPAPATVVHGGTIAFTAVVRNQGLGAAGPSSSLRFALVSSPGAAPIKNVPDVVPVSAVAPGTKESITAIVTIPSTTLPGTYFVRACVDTLNEVVESSDENNCGTSVDTLQVQ